MVIWVINDKNWIKKKNWTEIGMNINSQRKRNKNNELVIQFEFSFTILNIVC